MRDFVVKIFKRRSKMDKKRKGELAILFLKYYLSQKGVRINPSLKREIGNQAKAIGVSTEEATEFVETIIYEVVGEAFAK